MVQATLSNRPTTSDRSAFVFATVVEALFAHADERPDGLAYVVDDDRITYGDLRDDAMALAAALDARGIGRGDRCALVMGTTIDTVRALYAVQIAGAAPAIVNPAQPAAALHRRIALVRPKLVIGHDEAPVESGGVRVDELRAEGRPGWRPAALPTPADTAYLQITSGTSGEPKAAILSHRSLVACMRGMTSCLEMRSDDIFLSWVPLHHDMGLVRFTFFPCFSACPAYLIPPAVSNFERWLRLAGEVSATVTGGPDFGYRITGKSVDPGSVDLGALRYATNGGEPIRASTIGDFEVRFSCPGVIHAGYGLAEATLSVSGSRPGRAVQVDTAGCVSCGPPVDGLEVAIVDEAGRTCGPGEVGEITARGDSIFDGYLDDPEMTAEVLRDGWLHTGDMGYLDGDGELYVLGRKRVLIKRAGAMVMPREIEEAVDPVDGVRFSAVIGRVRARGPGFEEVVVVAEIRPETAADDEARLRIAHDIMAATNGAVGFTPDDVVLVRPRTIPRTSNGKIKHAELTRLYAKGDLGRDGAVLFSRRQ